MGLGMGVDSAKVCIVCGQDCSDRPRIKDAQGRYACKPCAAAASKRARSVQASRAQADPEPDAPEFDAVIGALASAGAPEGAIRTMEACPKCGGPVLPGQVICVQCGTNVATGKSHKTRVRDRADGEAPPPPSVARLALALAASAAGAAAGLGLWLAVSGATGDSSRVMVFPLGALAAAGALAVLRGAGTRASGGIAAVCAFAAIVGGLALTPADRLEGFEWEFEYQDWDGRQITETIEVLGIDEGQALIFGAAWLALGVLTASALGASSPYDPEDGDDE
jgi:hypothetical protein